MLGGEPSYTLEVRYRSDGKVTAALLGAPEWEPDLISVADDLTALAGGFLTASGYEEKWWHELAEQKWWVLGGFVIGSAITGGILACVL